MNRLLTLFLCFICSVAAFSAPDDYDTKLAKQYTQEAEYYQKKAEGYRREAQYYQKKAEGYEREAAYYSKKGLGYREKNYLDLAKTAMDNYETQMRYATNADDKAADYLKRAVRLLQK